MFSSLVPHDFRLLLNTQTIHTHTLRLWLVLWTANNIGVTLLNKAAFAKVDFHYPYFLSFVHMVCNSFGSQMVFWSIRRDNQRIKAAQQAADDGGTGTITSPIKTPGTPTAGGGGADNNNPQIQVGFFQRLLGNLTRKELDAKGRRNILAFSVIFSLNIAIGNVSLRHVSVNFNQVMRSLVPALTIGMGMALNKPVSMARRMAVLPVIVGVAMACFGDMSYTALGFFYTICCITLAALKVVAAGEMLSGSSKLHPVDLLGHMAPLALVQCLVLSLLTGEVTSIIGRYKASMAERYEVSAFEYYYPAFVVVLSGVCSFSLNICSLQANKLTSPLTLCIAANVKQVMMIAISTIVFATPIVFLNGCGIAVVLAGSAWYSYVSVMEKTGGSVAAVSTPKRGDVEENQSLMVPSPEKNTIRQR